MKAADVVDRLAQNIPLHTDGFSESLSITSILPTGTTALATTSAPHGLVEGQDIAITGADAPVDIDTGTFLRTAAQAVFETLQDHDLTLSERDIAKGGKTITISGATEAEFNGTFKLINVANRRKLTIAVDDSGSTTISGSPIVEDANGGIFNGFHQAVNITTTTFEYTLPIAYTLNAAGTPVVQIKIRILSVLDIEQYLRDVYTKQTIDADQLVVQLGDVSESKNRNEPSDATSSSSGNVAFTPSLIQPFAVYIVMNVTQELSAAVARDKVEFEYIPAIFRSILRAPFDTGFTYSQYKATFTGHGVFAYSDVNGKNKAVYAHEVAFEQLAKLYESDTVGTENTVAMRDIDFTMNSNLGTGIMLATVDLDEEPLP
ncbi:MAG: hypothetical protein KAR42_15390 [candidate division Zixibacteria bacterium]|nr:hypothetical protein [candidate division Zixibacteria bacterium]